MRDLEFVYVPTRRLIGNGLRSDLEICFEGKKRGLGWNARDFTVLELGNDKCVVTKGKRLTLLYASGMTYFFC